MKHFGFNAEVEAVEHGFCAICKKPVVMAEFKNELSKREYKISGMCQKCQDNIFC